MLIGNYFKNLNLKYKNHFFLGLSFNSLTCKKNNIFFAIKGTKIDGNKFIKDAIKKGARTIVSNLNFKGLKNRVLYIKSNNPRKLLSEVASKFYQNKPKNLIAVTGTNGKSSIADFYFQILNLNNKKVASLGTLGVKTDLKKSEIKNTTLDPISLNDYLQKIKKLNIDNVILEASSHGLKQNRLNGLDFKTGIFTIDPGLILHFYKNQNLQNNQDFNRSFSDILEEFTVLFEKLVKNQIENKSVILPISSGLDSRTLFVPVQNSSELSLCSYEFEGGFPESETGRKLSERYNIPFYTQKIQRGYLWNKLDELYEINKCFTDFTYQRQMDAIHQWKGLGNAILLGHWGDVLFDKQADSDHISYDEQIIQLKKKILKPGGRFFIFDSAMSCLKSHHDQVYHGVRRYSKGTLAERLQLNGFQVDRLDYVNALWFPLAFIKRRIERLIKFKPKSEVIYPNKFLNDLIYFLYLIDLRNSSKISYPFGINIVAHASKPKYLEHK